MNPLKVNPLKLRVIVACLLAASVVLGAVACAAFGWAAIAAALAIYALGAGAWLYHSIERYVVAKRLNTVIEANRLSPVRSAAKPLLPVMAAIIGLTQAVVRALGDVTDLPPQQRQPPARPPRRAPSLRPPRYLAITRGYRRTRTDDEAT
jgi:hypothetical protein